MGLAVEMHKFADKMNIPKMKAFMEAWIEPVCGCVICVCDYVWRGGGWMIINHLTFFFPLPFFPCRG